jgi:hypothetical protein
MLLSGGSRCGESEADFRIGESGNPNWTALHAINACYTLNPYLITR